MPSIITLFGLYIYFVYCFFYQLIVFRGSVINDRIQYVIGKMRVMSETRVSPVPVTGGFVSCCWGGGGCVECWVDGLGVVVVVVVCGRSDVVAGLAPVQRFWLQTYIFGLPVLHRINIDLSLFLFLLLIVEGGQELEYSFHAGIGINHNNLVCFRNINNY